RLGWKVPSPLLRRTETVPPPLQSSHAFTTARSGLPSPLRSWITTELGLGETRYQTVFANDGAGATAERARAPNTSAAPRAAKAAAKPFMAPILQRHRNGP